MAQAQNYTITSVEDTTFEPDQYGNKFYSVKFEGWDGKVLWKTPARPENNTQVYGSISPSKSGKAMIFKKEKKEDWRDGQALPSNTTDVIPAASTSVGYTRQGVEAEVKSMVERSVGSMDGRQPSRNDDIRWGLCTKEANAYVTKNRPDLSSAEWAKEVNEYANALYSVADKPKTTEPEVDTDAIREFFGGDMPL